jgi:Tol biopolymer transport system component
MTYPISRYLHVQWAFFPSFAADGQSMAFISDLTGVPQVWQVPAAGPWNVAKGEDQQTNVSGRGTIADGLIPWPRQLTFGEERVMGVWHAPVDGRLVYARDAGGNEKAQLFLLQPETAQEQA